jgi:hypothetical protein
MALERFVSSIKGLSVWKISGSAEGSKDVEGVNAILGAGSEQSFSFYTTH